MDSTTSVSGVVKDPAGKLPLFNAIVYVPNAPVGPLGSGVSCDRCGSVLGAPLVATLTNAQGSFQLNNMPSGKDIPLVIQIGKWRRQLVIPNVTACADTPLPDVRMPRNRAEGDIPQIAVTTGADDAMECWLRKVGLDDAEFTPATGPGRVHLYAGSGTPVTTAFNAARGGESFSSAQSLWSDVAALSRYDAVVLSCEGQTFPATKPPIALDALKTYANAGGRVLASHWHRYWFSTAEHRDPGGAVVEPAGAQPSPFAPFATWNDRADPPSPMSGTIDRTYPKPTALAAWLGGPAVAALDGSGLLPLEQAHHNVDAVDKLNATAMQWIAFANPNANAQSEVALLSSNMPTTVSNDQKCGRIVYADLHGSPTDARGVAWPDGCTSKDMSAQEKALEFMLFDLSSCIQDDRLLPAAPRRK